MHECDEQGRLVRSVTTVEPEWDDSERAWMLALAQYEALVHEPCGGWLPDTTAAEAEESLRGQVGARCHRCTAIATAQQAHVAAGAPHPEALLWMVTGGRT